MANIKILQFGEGNFLRAFVDWMMLPDSVVVVKPRPGKGLEKLLDTRCRYDVSLQGLLDGNDVNTIDHVDSIADAINPYEQYDRYVKLTELPELRFVVSNTTEAGICYDPSCNLEDRPALNFPAKLTQLLYHRWQHFHGDPSKGLTILPCELIFHNARELKLCVSRYIEQWQLQGDFAKWVDCCCPFYNTLVDRIVPGGDVPGVVKAEPYHLWVIEAPASIRAELPLRSADFNILFTDNEEPYHLRKVTLLNGPHTSLSAVGHLAGLETVRECMLHPVVGKYIDKVMVHELLPTVQLPHDELLRFAADVKDRFLNPYVRHLLTSIMLNNISKYRTRCLPALKWHIEHNGTLPEALTIALAANLVCAKLDASALADTSLWDEDLTLLPNLCARVSEYIDVISTKGILTLLQQ